MEVKKIADAFKILSDKIRLKIVKMLKGRIMCACELLEELNITQPTLSHHMRKLQQNQIVNAEKKGKWVHYSLKGEVIKELIEFLSNIEVIDNE